MKQFIISLALLGSLTGFAFAAGNPEAGQELTGTCSACHSADGNSTTATFPKLAGQGSAYLVKQMEDIRAGDRVVLEMTGMLDGFDDQQLADIAAFYESQSIKVGEADPALVKLGEALYKAGNRETGVPACTGCHAPDGSGLDLAKFPALGGQHADYIADQLYKFQRGYRAEEPSTEERLNDGDAQIMRSIAFNLKNFEIEALASYIQGLH